MHGRRCCVHQQANAKYQEVIIVLAVLVVQWSRSLQFEVNPELPSVPIR